MDMRHSHLISSANDQVWYCPRRFNETAFGSQLPQDFKISWNVHLKTTAGLTYYERKLVDGSDEPR